MFQRKFLILQASENLKKLLIFFSKESCLYVSGKRNPEKILYISGIYFYSYLKKIVKLQVICDKLLSFSVSHFFLVFKTGYQSYVKVPMPAHQVLPLTAYIFEASYSKSATQANKI